MTYLLDTNACIRILNDLSPPLVSRLHACRPSQLRLCSIVRAELLYAARKSKRSAENHRALQSFFAPFRSLPFDDSCADQYGIIRHDQERTGQAIGANDMMIAAIAMANELTLVLRFLNAT